MNVYHVRQELRTKTIYDMNLRFVYYARVSTDKEEQKNSIVNQREYYEQFIKSNKNWVFCGGYIDDGISGIHAERREEFQKMLADAKAGKFDFIITKEISRFARNTLDSIQYTRTLLSCGVCVWFQNDNINTIDDDSEFRLTIMAGVAQDEIRKLSSRIKFGHAQAIKNGVVLGNSRIYGYDKKGGKLTINPEEAEMVRLIFEKYATGVWSTPKLEKLLYEMGYRNYKGKKINRGVIQHIIANPKYKGYYAGGKVKIVDMFSKKQEFVPEDEWVMFKDDGTTVPAIVDEKTWARANEILKKRGAAIKERRTSFKTNNLFTGLIICGNDGATYWMKQHYVRGKEDVRWVCSHRMKNGASSCSSFGVGENEIKEMLARLINKSDVDLPKVMEQYIRLANSIIKNKAPDKTSMEAMESEKSLIQMKMDKLLDYNLSGVVSDEDFLRMNTEYKKKINEIDKKLFSMAKAEISVDGIEFRIKRMQSELKKYEGIKPSDIDNSVVANLVNNITIFPIAERKARVEISLKIGKTVEEYLGCSDIIFKKIYPEQHTVFYRDLRSFSDHRMPVEYVYCLAI